MDSNIKLISEICRKTDEEKVIYTRLVDSWSTYKTAIDTFNVVIDSGDKEKIITTMTTGRSYYRPCRGFNSNSGTYRL